ncbi:hypothetical protein GS907_24595 [Rhodococcus hoagii]|nr:hypothetical protein [Prescottella equi]
MYDERTDWVDTPKPPAKPGETPVKATDILRWERAHAEAHEQLDGRLSEATLNATYATLRTHLDADIAFRPELRDLYRQMQNPRTGPLVGVILGASSFEGAQASGDHQMSALLEKMFQSSFNPPGISGGYSIKVRNTAWAKVGTTGEVLDKDTRKMVSMTAGATATHITYQPSTGIDIFYPEGPGCGSFTVQIDDGAVFTITPGSTAAYDKVWKSPVLERKVHTYKITALADTEIGLAYVRDQDENVGVRLYNFSRAGASTKQFLAADADSQSTWTRLATIKPDFVIMALSHNNITYTTVPQFSADLETLWQRVNNLDPTKKVWMPCIAQHSTDDRYPAYAQALLDFAASKSTTTGIDYGRFFPSTTAAAAASGEFYTDNLHLNDLGHVIAAHIIAGLLGLPSRRTWPVLPPPAENANWDWKTDSNLVADWNALTLTGTIGDRVAAIPSARGSVTAPLAESSTAKQPTLVAGPNGLKAVAGLASEQRGMSVSFSAKTTPFTIAGVWRRVNGSLRMAAGVSANNLVIQIAGAQWRLDTSQAPAGYAPYTASTAWFIAAVVFNGSTTNGYLMSKTPTPFPGMSSNTVTTDGFSIFRNSGDTAWTDGEFGRAILFSRALSQFEVGRLFDTLSAETGIPVGA